jgi:hypothetical protein
MAHNHPQHLILTFLFAAACSKSMQSHAAEDPDGTGNAYADPGGSSASKTKGTAQMASTDKDIAVARRAIAQDLNVSANDVKVSPINVGVPGISVFSASVDPAKAGRQATRTGIIEGEAMYIETDAMSRIARAWGYGAKRTVSPVAVAEVFGALHSSTAASSAFIDDGTIQTYKKVSGPKRAAAVAMPKETTIDGNPAVVYCLTSSARSIPFSVVTAIVKPDFKVEIRAQPILED